MPRKPSPSSPKKTSKLAGNAAVVRLKNAYLGAFKEYDGNRGKAAAAIDVKPETVRQWNNSDAVFAEAVTALIDEIMTDMRVNPRTADGTPRIPCYISTRMGQNSPTKKTPENIQIVLATLAAGMSISHAAKSIGVNRETLMRWCKHDPEFSAEYSIALETGLDRLEDEAFRRAHDGVPKPVFHQGLVCGHVQEYSDTMLKFLLEGKRSSTFRRNAVLQLPPGGAAAGNGVLEVRWKDTASEQPQPPETGVDAPNSEDDFNEHS